MSSHASFEIRGTLSDEDLAAVVVALATLRRPHAPTPRQRSLWALPARQLRTPSGVGGWRASR